MEKVNFLNTHDLLQKRDQFKKIFFFRICGTGMGNCAALLKEMGLNVEGGDETFYPPMSDFLKELSIPLISLEEFSSEKMKEYDLIVVGNVVAKNSAWAKSLENSGVPLCSFPSALKAFLLEKRRVVGVAGTHGKTTTTYFLSQILTELGEKPGHLIGGVLPEGSSSHLGEGELFLIEADEYDCAYFEKVAKFRVYNPRDLILTSLEFDHADIYSNVEEIEEEFFEYLKNRKDEDGFFIFNEDYESAQKVRERVPEKLKAHAYGWGRDKHLKMIEQNEKRSLFQVGSERYETNVLGEHNLLNLGACILYARARGHSQERIQKSIENLRMVKRRQEVKGHYKKALIIDDFAHHPRAVEETIKAMRITYPQKKLGVVFSPHSATARSHLFEEGFAKALRDSDFLILTELVKGTTVQGAKDLALEALCEDWSLAKGTQPFVVSTLDELIKRIDEIAEQESVIVVMSNGPCLGLWESHFVQDLKKKIS